MKAKKMQKKKYKLKKRGISKYNNEIIGIIIFSMGILIFSSFYFENSMGLFGTFIREFLLGAMGLPAFLIPPLIMAYGVFIIFRKDRHVFSLRALYAFILLVLVSSLIQTGYHSHKDYENYTFIRYLVQFYRDGKNLSGGGILGGIISMPFLLTFQTLGTIIILTTACLIDIILLTNISIAGFVSNLRSVFVKAFKANADKRQEIKAADNDAKMFKPDAAGQGEKGRLESNSGSKVIDLEAERAARELKEKVNNARNSSIEGDAALPVPDQVGFVMKDTEREPAGEGGKESCSIETETVSAGFEACQYRRPPIELLEAGPDTKKDIKTYRAMAIEGARKLEETLSSFGVAAKVVNISRGPAVTRYELQPSAGVKVSKIVNLADDIALNLASSGVRIEAPIPGKAAIGIEVANKEISTVRLREVIESPEFIQHPSKLAFAIGKDITGECIVADIAKMPHLLVAGATGSGKSVCINSLIISLIYKASPDEVKFLMVDPKVVELGVYNGIPHLLIPVVTDPKKAAGALNWAVQEMVNRYKLFADKGVRDINGYNEMLKNSGETHLLPHIVIIIDELADLMMVAPNDVEDAICRLAQMARAAGMHLVIATQRPSVDVITGVIKANIPSRISFAVSSQVDSRTILDMAGAEKLLGKGDMLFYPVGRPKPIRVQGAFVSDKEVEKAVEFLKAHGRAEYDDNIMEEINSENELVGSDSGDDDELLPRAIELVVETGQASVSLIQRKFKVGYARAARIMDQMEERGIVGGYEGSKPRQILITKQQWQELKMSGDK